MRCTLFRRDGRASERVLGGGFCVGTQFSRLFAAQDGMGMWSLW
jgi:hypothetical protein